MTDLVPLEYFYQVPHYTDYGGVGGLFLEEVLWDGEDRRGKLITVLAQITGREAVILGPRYFRP